MGPTSSATADNTIRMRLRMTRLPKEAKLLLLSRLIFLTLSIYTAVIFSRIIFPKENQALAVYFSSFIAEVLVALWLVCVGLLSHDIASKRPSDYMSYSEIFRAYIRCRAFYLLGWWDYRKFLRASKDVKTAQKDWLMRLLRERKGTAFGKDHKFDTITSVEDFRSKIPMKGYDYYRGYMERAASGEMNVILPDKIVYIIVTSGTTGNNKKIPLTKKTMLSFVFNMLSTSFYITRKKDPSSFTLKQPLIAFVTPTVMENEAGISMSAASGCGQVDPGACTPFTAWKEIKDEQTMMYIHAVFGLLRDDVAQIQFVFLARSFFRTLETRWEDIVEDISKGTLNSDLDITPKLRTLLEKKLWPDPSRAAQLRYEFSQGFDNIVPRVWPKIHHIEMLSSGILQTPSVAVQKRYYPGVPIWDLIHTATEGSCGLCMNPCKDADDILSNYFTMLPHVAFYEFISFEDIDDPDPKTKLMQEIELNKLYELCMTTTKGVCRYRTGDIIKVVSFFNQVPQYELIGRHGVRLNICGEKMTEIAFTMGLQQTLSKLPGHALVDFTTTENRCLDNINIIDAKSDHDAGTERHYILFIELETKNGEVASLTDEQKDMFDENLQCFNENYSELREEGRIQKMVVVQTVPCAFARLKQLILAGNPRTSSIQYKTPRVLKKEAELKLMIGQAAQPWRKGE